MFTTSLVPRPSGRRESTFLPRGLGTRLYHILTYLLVLSEFVIKHVYILKAVEYFT